MIEPHASWVRGLARAVGVNSSAIQVKARLCGLFPTNLHPRRSVASVPIRVLFQRLGPARAGLEHGDATPKRRRQGTACRALTCSRKQAPRAPRQAQTIPDKTHHKGFHLCQSEVIQHIAPQRTFKSGTSRVRAFQPSTFPPSTFNLPTFNLITFNVQRSTFQPSTFPPSTFNLQPSNLQPSHLQPSTLNSRLTPPPSAPSPRCNPSVSRDRGCAR
jgi:hypothetical protein